MILKFLAILAVLAIPPAVYFETLGAKRKADLQAADQQLAELDMRIEMAKAAQRKLPQFRAEMTRMSADLERMNTILPASPAIDDIHALVESTAAENDLQLTQFDPGKPTTGNALEEQTMTAEVVGSAEGTAAFLKKIGNASRLINVSGVTATKDPAGWRTDFLMTTYALGSGTQ